jgi:hypothetical protein
MKLDEIEPQILKTVWMRRTGKLKAVQVPVKSLPAAQPYPMFPIERPPHEQQ